MEEDEFHALQERMLKLIDSMENGEVQDEPEQAINDLKTLTMLATRFRKGLEEEAYEGNWSNAPRDRKKDGIWIGPGFGGELAREAMMGWGMTYSHLIDYDTYFKRP